MSHHPRFPDGTPWPELMTPDEAVRALRLDTVGRGKSRDADAALRELIKLVESGVLQVTRIGEDQRFSLWSVLRCIDRLTEPAADDDAVTAMTPDHPRWDEFCERMEEQLPFSKCPDRKRPKTVGVLKAMNAEGGEQCDVEESLAYFSLRGGTCSDTEVFLNVVCS